MGTGRSNVTTHKVSTERDLVATLVMPYKYNNAPTPVGIPNGQIRFNNTNISIATECYMSYVDGFSFPAGDVLSRIAADDLMRFYIDEGRFINFTCIDAIVTPPTGPGGYVTFTLDLVDVTGIINNNRDGSVSIDLGGAPGSFVELFDDTIVGIDVNMPVIGDRYLINGLTVKELSPANSVNVSNGTIEFSDGGSGKYFAMFTFTIVLNKTAEINGELQTNGIAQNNIKFTKDLISGVNSVISISGDFRVNKGDTIRLALFSDKANVIANIKTPNCKIIRIKE